MTANLVFIASPQIDAQRHLPAIKQKLYIIPSAQGSQAPISVLMKQVEERENALNQALKTCTKLEREVNEENIQKFADVESYMNLEIKQLEKANSVSPGSPMTSGTSSGARAAPLERQLADYTLDHKYVNYNRLLNLKREQEAANAAGLHERPAEYLLEEYGPLERINDTNRNALQPTAIVISLESAKLLEERYDDIPGAVPETLEELARDGQNAVFGCIVFRPEIPDFQEYIEKTLQATAKFYDFNVQPQDNTVFSQFTAAQRAYNDHLLVSASAVAKSVVLRAFERCAVEATLRFGSVGYSIIGAVLSAKELMAVKKELREIFADELEGENLYDDADDGFLPYVMVNACVWG